MVADLARQHLARLAAGRTAPNAGANLPKIG